MSELILAIVILASGVAAFGVALWLVVFISDYKELKAIAATSAATIRALRSRLGELESN